MGNKLLISNNKFDKKKQKKYMYIIYIYIYVYKIIMLKKFL